jgi:hypothetical protein
MRKEQTHLYFRYKKVKEKVIKWLNTARIEDFSLMAVVLFVEEWLLLGNYWSMVSTYQSVNISTTTIVISAIIYSVLAIPVIVFFFIELYRLKSKLKWIIAVEVITFFAFVIAPPRNADAMRVWLAKVYDVWMHGKKIVRPYFHYNTPDAFTLFHLPLINLWDGQIFQFSIWIALCAVLILFIKIGRVYTSDRAIAVGLCLFLFNPLIILASTVVITDIPMILAVAGLVYAMILYEQRRFNKSLFLVALFTAFGMNIKYNMLMFLPAVLYWSAKKVWADGINWKSLPLVMALIMLAVFPYYMNYLNIGNPVWPALTKYFPAKNLYWDEIASNHAEAFLGGKRNLWNFIESFSRLFIMPHHINPLAIFTVFFVFARFKYLNFIPAIMTTTYFFVLWLMMPQFSVAEKERYVLYLLPIIIPFGMSKIYELTSSYRNGEKIKKIFETLAVATILLYSVFTLVYSKDVFSYIYTGNKTAWHRATWYYEDYNWINKNITLNESGKILVIVSNQQTYYLKKPYVNGDELSALIDWRTMTDLSTILSALNKYNIQYIFIDADYVKGNHEIKRTFDILLKEKAIEQVRENKINLVASRLRDIYTETHTVLYKVKKVDFCVEN